MTGNRAAFSIFFILSSGFCLASAQAQTIPCNFQCSPKVPAFVSGQSSSNSASCSFSKGDENLLRSVSKAAALAADKKMSFVASDETQARKAPAKFINELFRIQGLRFSGSSEFQNEAAPLNTIEDIRHLRQSGCFLEVQPEVPLQAGDLIIGANQIQVVESIPGIPANENAEDRLKPLSEESLSPEAKVSLISLKYDARGKRFFASRGSVQATYGSFRSTSAGITFLSERRNARVQGDVSQVSPVGQFIVLRHLHPTESADPDTGKLHSECVIPCKECCATSKIGEAKK